MEEKSKQGVHTSNVDEVEELMLNVSSFEEANKNRPLPEIPLSFNVVGCYDSMTNTNVNIPPKLPGRNLKHNLIVRYSSSK